VRAARRARARVRVGSSWRRAWVRRRLVGTLRGCAAGVRGAARRGRAGSCGRRPRPSAGRRSRIHHRVRERPPASSRGPKRSSGSVVAFLFFTSSRVVVVVVVVAWTAADDGEDLHGRFVRPSATRGAGTVAEDHRLDGVEGVGAATGGAAARRSRRGRLRGGRRHGSCGPSRWVSLDFVQSGLHHGSSEGNVSRRPWSTEPVASSEKKFNSGESLRWARG
jgi:hypothetical protein